MFGKKKDTDERPTWKLTYKGGLADLPKAKIGEIRLTVAEDRFVFAPTVGSKKFWTELQVPFSEVDDVEAVDRTVSTFEGVAGGLDSRQLNQKNVLLFSYGDGQVLRMEMLTGVSVMGQAKKTVEFLDQLRSLGVRSQFRDGSARSSVPAGGVGDELTKLAELHAAGALSDDEFSAAKTRLLG